MKTSSKRFLALIFSFIFIFLTIVPYAYATDNTITEVNITVPVPHVGETIPYHDAITVDNENCIIGLIGWITEKNGVEAFAKSEVFLPGFNYTLLLDLKSADKNCIFADNCKVTVNGNPVNYMVVSSGKYLAVEYDFGIPESSSDSSISYLELFRGYIQEIFERISHIIEQTIISIFGIRFLTAYSFKN